MRQCATAGGEVRRNARGGCGDCVGEFQHQLLIVTEKIAVLVVVQIAELLVAQAHCSAAGRVNVNSKRTLHQLGGADLRQDLQLCRK